MIEAVVPALILLISLFGVKKRENDYFLSIDQGNALKGVAALLLVIVHIRERLEIVPVAYKALAAGGYLLVSIFFFYSGYGISKQTGEKEKYVLERLPKRIIYLIKLIIISEIVYYFVDVFIFERQFNALDMIKCIFGITMLNGALWTIVAMLIIQIAYYIGYRLGGVKNSVVLAIIGCGVYILITAIRGRGAWEMQSCCAFILGSFVAVHEEYFCSKIKKTQTLILTFIVFTISFILPYVSEKLLYNDYTIIRVLAGTVASCSFIVLLLIIISKVRIQNKLIIMCGSIFTEIYLWHGIVLDLIKRGSPSSFAEGHNYILISIVCVVIVLAISVAIKEIETKGKFHNTLIKQNNAK